MERTLHYLNAFTKTAEAAIKVGDALVQGTADKQAKPSAGTVGEKFIGVATMPAAIGQTVGVMDKGTFTGIAGEAIAAGDLLEAGAGGKFFVASDRTTAVAQADASAVLNQPFAARLL